MHFFIQSNAIFSRCSKKYVKILNTQLKLNRIVILEEVQRSGVREQDKKD